MYFGAHVSIAGGIFNAPLNAAAIGAEVFQIFTRSPHGGKALEIKPDFEALLRQNMRLAGIPECYVHAPYFINFASNNNRVRYGSISVLKEELQRSSLIGAKYLMTHLGSYSDMGQNEGFKKTVEGLKKVLEDYDGSTQFLIEISAGSGDVIGSSFEEIAEFVHHKDLAKFEIGVCFDTQHAFASGYDIRTESDIKKTFDHFNNTVGIERLKMFHCNDSLVPFDSKLDRHHHIGKGKIGEKGFESLFAYFKDRDVNFVLETKHDYIENDLQLVKKLRSRIY
jgi:deoxyribonuclease-4